MNRRRQAGGAMPSKKKPGRSYPKGLKPAPAGRKKPAPMPSGGSKKKRPMPPKGYQKGGAKDLKNLGIEESKEVKFGKPDIPKKAQDGSWIERSIRDRERAGGADNSSVTSQGFSKPKGKVGEGTVLKPQDERPKTKTSNPYADAKKRDPQLDSYIKQRNAAEKGSSAYNEAQNKINRAYGKGPIRKVEPIKKVEPKKAAPVENKSAPKPTLKTAPKPAAPKAPEPKSKADQRTDRRVGRIEERKKKRDERKGERADKKQGRMDRRDRIRVAKGKKPKQGFDPSKATSSPPYNEKKQYGGPRKKAMIGAMVAGGGQALKGVGSLVNAISGKETKFGNIANSVGDVAGGIGSMMGPGGAAANKVGGALNNAVAPNQGAGTPGGEQQGLQAAGGAPTQPDPNQTQRYGGMKKKRKGGKMKYKGGGAKPDYLDMDGDGNKKEPMKSALKDRRKRRGGRR